MEGEISCFSSSPLYNSLGHEDITIHLLEPYDRGFRSRLIHSSYHNFDFPTVDLSKKPVFDDPYSDEFETPQAIEILHTELMVMSGYRSLEVSSTSDLRSIESF